MVFNLLTFPSIKEIISNKLSKEEIDEVLLKERMAGSVAREFFMKQIKIRINKNAHYTLEQFFTLISIPTFTFSLNNQEWESASKVIYNLMLQFGQQLNIKIQGDVLELC